MLNTHGAFKEDPRNKFVFDELLKFSEVMNDGSTIIDVGAGQCELAMFFERSNYIGLDLAVGDSNWDFSKLSVRCDVQTIPIKSGSADSVLNI